MEGSRSAGLLAATWASMVHLGRRRLPALRRGDLRDRRRRCRRPCGRTPRCACIGSPTFLFSFTSDEFDIYLVNDFMRGRGWRLNGQQYPNALHMAVTRPQTQPGVADAFAADLADAVADAKRRHGRRRGARTGAIYGGVAGGLTDEADEFIRAVMTDMLDGMQSVPPDRDRGTARGQFARSPIDLGTTALKVGLVSFAGDGRVERPRDVPARRVLPGGAASRTPASGGRRSASMIRRAGDRGRPAGPGRVVSVTGQWASTVPVDDDGTPVGAVHRVDRHQRAGATPRSLGGPVAGYCARRARPLDPAHRRRAVAERQGSARPAPLPRPRPTRHRRGGTLVPRAGRLPHDALHRRRSGDPGVDDRSLPRRHPPPRRARLRRRSRALGRHRPHQARAARARRARSSGRSTTVADDLGIGRGVRSSPGYPTRHCAGRQRRGRPRRGAPGDQHDVVDQLLDRPQEDQPAPRDHDRVRPDPGRVRRVQQHRHRRRLPRLVPPGGVPRGPGVARRAGDRRERRRAGRDGTRGVPRGRVHAVAQRRPGSVSPMPRRAAGSTTSPWTPGCPSWPARCSRASPCRTRCCSRRRQVRRTAPRPDPHHRWRRPIGPLVPDPRRRLRSHARTGGRPAQRRTARRRAQRRGGDRRRSAGPICTTV